MVRKSLRNVSIFAVAVVVTVISIFRFQIGLHHVDSRRGDAVSLPRQRIVDALDLGDSSDVVVGDDRQRLQLHWCRWFFVWLKIFVLLNTPACAFQGKHEVGC